MSTEKAFQNKSNFSDINLSNHGIKGLEVKFGLICSDATLVCDDDLVETMMNHVGKVEKLELINSKSAAVVVLVDRIVFLDAVEHGEAGDHLLSRGHAGHFILIMASFTIIGLIIGVSLLGPALRHKYSCIHNIYSRRSNEDLFPIVAETSNTTGRHSLQPSFAGSTAGNAEEDIQGRY